VVRREEKGLRAGVGVTWAQRKKRNYKIREGGGGRCGVDVNKKVGSGREWLT